MYIPIFFIFSMAIAPLILLYFVFVQEAVNDIDWSPMSPTVIGIVNDSQVEIWDLANST